MTPTDPASRPVKTCSPLATRVLLFGALGLFFSIAFLLWGMNLVFYTTDLFKWAENSFFVTFIGTTIPCGESSPVQSRPGARPVPRESLSPSESLKLLAN
jgi:hypothetical protein